MFRILALLAAASAVLSAQTAAPKPSGAIPAAKRPSALDKTALEAYLRHLFVWPPPIQLNIDEPKNGPMPGYYEVKVRGVSGAQMQEETFFVSHDGQKIVRGVVYDIAQNPFKAELDKINTEGRPGFGTPGAPVVIAEFSDFECPFCREEAKSLRDNALKVFPKEVRVYFFDFPLVQIHPWAKPAAMAGRCIFKESAPAWWDYHDWIFDKQTEITADNLRTKVMEFAKTKDLDAGKLGSCIDSRATEPEVDQTMKMGGALTVNQTPTLFVNGRRVPGASSWNELKFMIDYEIQYQKTAKNAGEDCGCDVRLPGFAGEKPGEKTGTTLHK